MAAFLMIAGAQTGLLWSHCDLRNHMTQLAYQRNIQLRHVQEINQILFSKGLKDSSR